MQQQGQAFLELIWPSRYDPIARYERRIAMLQALLALVIALTAGPEIFVAMEMTAVLELLGAILFLIAMAAGAKLMALSFWNVVRQIAFPLPVVVRRNASIPARALALISVVGHGAWCVASVFNCRCVWSLGHSAGRTSE